MTRVATHLHRGIRLGWPVAVIATVSILGCSEATTDVNADGTSPGDADAGQDGATLPDTRPATDAGSRDVGLSRSAVVINEVAPRGEPDDWFELYNPSSQDVFLDGWTFTDNPDEEPRRSAFRDGSVVEAGGYLHVQFRDRFPGFGLGDDEQLGVFDEAGRLVDLADWDSGDAPDGTSLARLPDGSGEFVQSDQPTPGAPNVSGEGTDCGDGALETGEECDDGNRQGGDGCSPTCRIIPREEERCDDGLDEDEDGRTDCADDDCLGGVPCLPECGNGIIDGDEECDDGNDESGDGCSADCEAEGAPARVFVNEVVFAHSDEIPDWIELYNAGDEPAELRGWALTDDQPGEEGHRFEISSDVVLSAGGFLVFERARDFDFGLGETDAARVIDASGRLVDELAWEIEEPELGTSFGRLPDGGSVTRVLATPTPGASNRTD